MKVSDFLEKSFPTEEPYRLVHVDRIFGPKGSSIGVYKLALTFHRISEVNLSDLRNIRDLGPDSTFRTACHIAFERLLAVGSIWANKSNPQVILPSSYLDYFSISDEFLESNEVMKTDTSVFIENFGITESVNNKELVRHPGILMYELDNTLFKHRTEGGEVRFFKHKPPWDDPDKIDFVAFNSYEVHRYFFSSVRADLTNFNSRLLIANQFSSKNNESNQIFNSNRSKFENGRYLVFLRNINDLDDCHTIGNIAYYPVFREKVSKMQNMLNVHGYYYFSWIEGLPISEFSRLKGYAFRVIRKDGKKGLYFIQLQSVTKTIDHSYVPVMAINDGKEVFLPIGGRYDGGSMGTKERLGYNYEGGSNPNDRPLEVDSLGLDELLNPTIDVNVEDLLQVKADDDRLVPGRSDANVSEGGGNLNPPGVTDGRPGFKPIIRNTIQARDYFDHFPGILKEVELHLIKRDVNVLLNFYSQNLFTQTVAEVIDCSQLVFQDSTIVNQAWFLYLGVFEIEDRGQLRYYYLFEKTSISKPNSRTWLYCADGYRLIDNDNLLDEIYKFLYHDYPTDASRAEPNNKFNHKQSESRMIGGESYDVQISQENAIEMQVTKITSRILKTLDL